MSQVIRTVPREFAGPSTSRHAGSHAQPRHPVLGTCRPGQRFVILVGVTTAIVNDEVPTVHAVDGQYLFEADAPPEGPWPLPWQGLLPERHLDCRDHRHARRPGLEADTGGRRLRDLSGTPRYRPDAAPGPYRVRVRVAQRAGAAAIGDTREPWERHLPQLWPTADDTDPPLLTAPDTYAMSYQ